MINKKLDEEAESLRKEGEKKLKSNEGPRSASFQTSSGSET